jgi:hypothetical protein
MRAWILALVCAVACGGSKPPKIEIGPPPPKGTKGSLAGATCTADECKCRSAEADPGVPDDARKRFEVRLKSAYELWVTLPNTVLYKSPERAETCFYVDLHPGKHPLEMRASNPTGVSFELQLSELGTKTKSWYSTFTFKCGHPGVCSFAELDDVKAAYANVKRNLHDACGSTKIKGVIWDHGKQPDQQYPSELAMRLTMDVYKFAPWKPHGDSTCGEGGGRGPDGEPAPEEAEPAKE